MKRQTELKKHQSD